MLSNCKVCKEPITDIEIVLSSQDKICINCGNCLECNKQVTIDEIRNCISNNRPIKHDKCARVPRRRCHYIDATGQQCDTWFPAIDSTKLCVAHREIITPNGHINEDQKVKYIDLVNDEKHYCYHFINGEPQNQDKTLIHEFKDDEAGTVFEKLDRHIAFLEKVIEDLKARTHSARAVRSEKLDELTEEERKILRAQKIDKTFREKASKEKLPSFKTDPVAFLSKKNSMSRTDAEALLTMDDDALLAKFAEAKKNKELRESK